MKVLAIGAHPDDVELGCGGLVSKNESYILLLTEGECGGEGRASEALASSEILGATLYQWLFGDTKLVAPEIIPVIESTIETLSPDMILTMDSLDNHQDHREVAAATLVAIRRYHGIVLSYAGPSNPQFVPNWFEPLTDSAMEKKLQALRCHKSQLNKSYLNEDYVLSLARHWAITTHSVFKYAEPYKFVRKS